MIWCAISGHGYGHAAQVVPVLNELARRISGLKAILRTTVPEAFFRDRLMLDWKVSHAQQDIGCVQRGPLDIDIDATWEAHERFHRDWTRRVASEAAVIRAARPRVVLSDISPLAIAAARVANVPAVALCNLSWDLVLEPFLNAHDQGHHHIVDQIREAYGAADYLLRPEPGLEPTAFRKVVPVGPVLQRATPDRQAVIDTLHAAPDEVLVLIGFGGVPLEHVPLDALEQLAGYRFIYSGTVPAGTRRITPHSSVPLSYPSLLASVDVIVTKAGYSTAVEAVAHRKPVLYVRRSTFADEDTLVAYLHRHGRAVELPRSAFDRGDWQPALDEVRGLPPPHANGGDENGACQAARILASDFF